MGIVQVSCSRGKASKTKADGFGKENWHVPCAVCEVGSPGGVQKAEPLPEEQSGKLPNEYFCNTKSLCGFKLI